MRQTISCATVVFNEERNIRDCLETAKWMDEIIVVDAFSQDRTLEICRQYTTRIYRTACLRALPAEKRGTRRLGILIAAPVCGLRATRAFRFEILNMPNPTNDT